MTTTEYTTDEAEAARQRILARPATAADLLDGGERIRESIKAAEQNAEAEREAKDAARSTATKQLVREQKLILQAYQELIPQLVAVGEALKTALEARKRYDLAWRTARAAGVSPLPNRIEPIPVLAQSDDELRAKLQGFLTTRATPLP